MVEGDITLGHVQLHRPGWRVHQLVVWTLERPEKLVVGLGVVSGVDW
jgi:cell shape-determining protein MreD